MCAFFESFAVNGKSKRPVTDASRSLSVQHDSPDLQTNPNGNSASCCCHLLLLLYENYC